MAEENEKSLVLCNTVTLLVADAKARQVMKSKGMIGEGLKAFRCRSIICPRIAAGCGDEVRATFDEISKGWKVFVCPSAREL